MPMVYLDNAATTPVLPEAVEAMREAMLEDFGNPSSLHRLGISAEKKMEAARNAVAQALSCQAEEVYFTSGGTEGSNLLLRGAVLAKRRQGRHVLTTPIEHPSVLDTLQVLAEAGEIELELIPVDQDGVVILPRLQEMLRDDTILVSVMLVNNETGTIQPIAEIGSVIERQNPHTLLHVDAIQALGKLDTNVSTLGADLMTLSGHKINGPKGVGAIFIRKGVRLSPQQHGGGQERGLRSGTENVPGIVGMGTALAAQLAHRSEAYGRVTQLKQHAWNRISQQFSDVCLNGALERTSPYILNVGFPSVRGEVLIHYLEADGIFVSTGAACSSRKRIVSHVLEAMGVEASVAEGSIRISFSQQTTQEHIERLVQSLSKAIPDLRRLSRR